MMDETAALLIVKNGKDEDGFAVEKTEEIDVYVREKSATRSEFYQALMAGITAKMVLEMRTEDFELSAHYSEGRKEYATQIRYDGAIYDIVRTYKKDKGMIELTCS